MASADGLFLPAELGKGGVPVSVAQLRQDAHHRRRNQTSRPDDAPGVRLRLAGRGHGNMETKNPIYKEEVFTVGCSPVSIFSKPFKFIISLKNKQEEKKT